jgi:hypothetical protein
MPARLYVHEGQLAEDVGDHGWSAGSARGQQCAVQHDSALTVEPAHRVDEGCTQRTEYLGLQSWVFGQVGLLRGAAQRFDSGVDRAGGQGGRSRPEQRLGYHRHADA